MESKNSSGNQLFDFVKGIMKELSQDAGTTGPNGDDLSGFVIIGQPLIQEAAPRRRSASADPQSSQGRGGSQRDGIIRRTGQLMENGVRVPVVECRSVGGGPGGSPPSDVEQRIDAASRLIMEKVSLELEPAGQPLMEMFLDLLKLLHDRTLLVNSLEAMQTCLVDKTPPSDANLMLFFTAVTTLIEQEPVLSIMSNGVLRSMQAAGMSPADLQKEIIKGMEKKEPGSGPGSPGTGGSGTGTSSPKPPSPPRNRSPAKKDKNGKRRRDDSGSPSRKRKSGRK